MKKKGMIFICCAVAVIIAVVLIVVNIVIPGNKYKKATSMLESGDYVGAVEAFTALGDYKDSADQAASAQQEVDYQAATSLFENGDYAGAVEAFKALGDYKDSADQAASAQQEVDYQAATALMEKEDYAGAVEAFTALSDYKDSAEQAKAAQQGVDYQAAQDLLDKEDYAGAVEAFTALGNYKDSKDQAAEAQKKLDFEIAQQNLEKYNSATAMAEIGSYSDAYKIFEDLGDYNDSPKKSEEMRTARFEEGKDLFDDKKYEKAYDVFSEVAGWTYHEEYANVEEMEPAYYAAASLFCMDKFEDAYDAFIELGDYADSAVIAQACLNEPIYRDALALYEDEKYEDAKKAFDDLGDYKDSESYSNMCADHLTYNSLMDQLTEAEKMEEGSDDQKEKLKEIYDGFVELGVFLDSQEQAYQIADKYFDEETKASVGMNASKGKTAAAKDAINIRSEASINGSVLGTLYPGQEVSVVSLEGDWARIMYKDPSSGDVVGYVRSNFLDYNSTEEHTSGQNYDLKISPALLSEEEELRQLNEYTAEEIGTKFANADMNVRQGPTNDGDNIISSLDKGEEITIIGETANWYEIYKAEDTVTGMTDLKGFIMKRYISDTYEEAMTEDHSKIEESISMVEADMAFSGEFEKSDGEESVVISLVNNNQISFKFRKSGLKAMAEASGSSAIYYGDDKKALSFDVAGDIMAVTVSGEGGDQSPMNGIYYRVVEEADTVTIKSDANIRKYANGTSDVVGVVNAGAKVKKIGSDDDGVQIEYNGVQGYVKASMVE